MTGIDPDDPRHLVMQSKGHPRQEIIKIFHAVTETAAISFRYPDTMPAAAASRIESSWAFLYAIFTRQNIGWRSPTCEVDMQPCSAAHIIWVGADSRWRHFFLRHTARNGLALFEEKTSDDRSSFPADAPGPSVTMLSTSTISIP